MVLHGLERAHLSRLGSRCAPEPEGGGEAAPAARSHRRVAAREAEPAQMRAALSQEGVRLASRTPPVLHYDRAVASHLKARRVLTALRLCRRAGPVRTETAAWDARELAS